MHHHAIHTKYRVLFQTFLKMQSCAIPLKPPKLTFRWSSLGIKTICTTVSTLPAQKTLEVESCYGNIDSGSQPRPCCVMWAEIQRTAADFWKQRVTFVSSRRRLSFHERRRRFMAPGIHSDSMLPLVFKDSRLFFSLPNRPTWSGDETSDGRSHREVNRWTTTWKKVCLHLSTYRKQHEQSIIKE